MKLISNGFGYQINDKEAILWYSETNHAYATKAAKDKKGKKINENAIGELLSFNSESEVFYYSFNKLEGLDKHITVSLVDRKLKKEFVKWKLFDQLRSRFIIDLHNYGSDLVIYRKNQRSFNAEWDSYSGYNILIRGWEIFISISSKNTLISKGNIVGFKDGSDEFFRGIKDNLIIHKKYLNGISLPCIASREIKISQKLYSTPERPKFSTYFSIISGLYKEFSEIDFEGISLFKDGFRKLEEDRDYFQVARTYNVMMFGGGKTDVSVSNGLKKYGPYDAPETLFSNLEFIFIYSSKEKVTELHNDLRYGKGYFTGLERFVKVPLRTPTKDFVLKYEQNMIEDLPALVNEKLVSLKLSYPNKKFFAIVLLPEAKKDSETIVSKHEPHYYDLKRVLLRHQISSQFIDEREIGKNDFVYWLPNIAVAILAKLGGVPWRLNRENERELIIGFGVERKDNKKFLGSAVYFDNSGKLQSSEFFTTDDPRAFVQILNKSILGFIKNQVAYPDKLVIHYYKIPGSYEIGEIDNALKDLALDIPYVIVTINDTKSKEYIAFDEEYNYGMPISGISWKVALNEYVLFNNTRYELRPTQGKPPTDEYPIKLKLHFSNNFLKTDNTVRHAIGQVFEFSRIYWKSIKQQSKPVTATYSEMIAEFGYHFGQDEIPHNDFPWFI